MELNGSSITTDKAMPMPSEEMEVGSFYEINHAVLQPNCYKHPGRIWRAGVVMVSDKRGRTTSLSFPSVCSLQAHFRKPPVNRTIDDTMKLPSLDEKYVLRSDVARELLLRRVSATELAEKKDSWGFWVINFCHTPTASSLSTPPAAASGGALPRQQTVLSPPPPQLLSAMPMPSEEMVGSFYEVNHAVLAATKYRDQLRRNRVVMVSDKRGRTISLSFPSICSVLIYLSGLAIKRTTIDVTKKLPLLDQTYVMRSGVARQLLLRRVSATELAEKKDEWLFWVMKSSDTPTASSLSTPRSPSQAAASGGALHAARDVNNDLECDAKKMALCAIGDELKEQEEEVEEIANLKK